MILRRNPHNTGFDKKVEYAGFHFATEGRYMIDFNFMKYSAHNTEHEKFVTKANELKERVSGSGFVLTLEVLSFLKD